VKGSDGLLNEFRDGGKTRTSEFLLRPEIVFVSIPLRCSCLLPKHRRTNWTSPDRRSNASGSAGLASSDSVRTVFRSRCQSPFHRFFREGWRLPGNLSPRGFVIRSSEHCDWTKTRPDQSGNWGR